MVKEMQFHIVLAEKVIFKKKKKKKKRCPQFLLTFTLLQVTISRQLIFFSQIKDCLSNLDIMIKENKGTVFDLIIVHSPVRAQLGVCVS